MDIQHALAIVEAITTVATVLLIYRIFSLRLRRHHLALLAYLSVDVVGDCGAMLFGIGSMSYYTVFKWTLPAYCILLVLMAREIFLPLYRAHPGLRVLTRRMLLASISLSLALALPSIPATQSKWSRPDFHCGTFIVQEILRYEMIAATAFVIAMLVGLRRFPLRVSGNILTNAVMFSALCFTFVPVQLAGLLVHRKEFIHIMDCVQLSLTSVCYAVWAIVLRGGAQAMVISPVPDPELQLFRNLDQMNAVCARVAEAGRTRAADLIGSQDALAKSRAQWGETTYGESST